MDLERWLRGRPGSAFHTADAPGFWDGMRKGAAILLLIPIELLEIASEIVNFFGWMLMWISAGIGRMQADLRQLGLILIGVPHTGGCGECPSCQMVTLLADTRQLISQLEEKKASGATLDGTDKAKVQRAVRAAMRLSMERKSQEG